jgi:peptidoglycan/xylan/chitin deacetylase (PgdA/CDA1 family)
MLPYIMLPRSGSPVSVLWSAAAATVICRDKTGNAAAWRYTQRNGNSAFLRLEIPASAQAALSPGGDKAVIWGKNGAVLYDYRTWLPVQTLKPYPVRSCIWVSNDELVIGGEELIERISFVSSKNTVSSSELVCLASVSEYGFERGGYRILAKSAGTWFVTNGIVPWTEADGIPDLKEASQRSPSFDVFLLERRSGMFANMPFVKKPSETEGNAFFPAFAARPPVSEQRRAIPVSETEGVFSRGSRASGSVALCFDLYDDDAGLYPVLDALSRYGFKATFFLNGEFIRRFPGETAAIAAAGHESASMFHVSVDFSDSRYRIDRDFVVQGLARCKDDYFRAAGRELAPVWHPPWYAFSRDIVSWAAGAGYKTIGRDIDPGDWIHRADARRTGIEQPAAAAMIDDIMDALQGGSIIPIRLGALPGGRNDYLYNSLELLLDAIVRAGYDVTPVSRLPREP